MYYRFIRQVLFQLEPEKAHEFAFQKLRCIIGTPFESFIQQKTVIKPVNCMGLTFRNALGLAAGLDKNGEYIEVFKAMGFGFVEIGTVTPNPQIGNEKPRLFRLPEAEGIINRMGFNNLGIDYLVNKIKESNFDNIILGINIGKNQDTPIEYGKDDYLVCMEKIYNYANYIVLNISSPNTPDLRTLQYGEILDDLLVAIKSKQKDLQQREHRYVPVVVKIAPDLSREELVKIADSLVYHNIDGVIATNTTIDRSLVQNMKYCNEVGGLSGRPIQSKSTEIIRCLYSEINGRLPIIGVGGIDSVIAAREKIAAGASLIQICSGFIFKGPTLIRKITKYI